MAVATGDNDLRRLEREAETARARLHETIAEIRDPRTMDNAKLEMKHRANEMKDRAMDYVRGRRDEWMDGGRSQANDFSRRLQRTAIENPLPVLMIGAGIGWHLWKRPPVTSVLLGTGIWQLMKNWDRTPDTSAWRDPYNRSAPRGYVPGGVAGREDEEITDLPSAVTAAKVGATDLSYRAEDAISGVADTLTQAKEAVTARVQDMAGRVQANMQPVMDRAAPMFNAQNRQQMGTIAVIAGAGLLAGGLLRNSETGRRWFEEARLQADRGMNRMRDMTREMRVSLDERMERDTDQRSGMRSYERMDQRSAQEMAAEHPVLLSMLGLAIGAVLGGMIRQMPPADMLVERASDAMDNLREAVTGESAPDKQAQAQRDRVMVHAD